MLRVIADTAIAIRALRAAPGTSAAVVVTVAVAVGINLAMIELVERALFSAPARVVDPERVFTLDFETTSSTGERILNSVTSYRMFQAIRDHTPALEDASAWFGRRTTATIDGQELQTNILRVTGAYFSMLRARPSLGRVIQPDDDRPPIGSPVAVVSHAFWRSKLGTEPPALGRHLRISGIDYVVVGVMPAGFSGHSTDRVDLWIPLHAGMREVERWESLNTVVIGGRIAVDASPAAVATEASHASRQRVVMTSIAQANEGRDPALFWLSAVSVLLLVVGLANAATLLMVQRARRRREYSVRAALGATRGWFAMTIALEAAILSTTAAIAALLLASWFAEAVRYFLLPSLVERVGWGAHSIVAAILAGFATFAVTSIVGLLQLPSLVRLEHLTSSGGGHWRRSAAQSELMLIQTALAVILIVGAGLFARSYREEVTQDVGMRIDDLFLVGLDPGEPHPHLEELLTQAAAVLREVPAIVKVTPVQVLPLTLGVMGIPMSVPGLSDLSAVDADPPQMHAATPELFDMLRLRLVQGRRLTTQDDTEPPVAVVNETMARTLWPGRSAIGSCFRVGVDPTWDPATATSPPRPPATAPCFEVVGIVQDVSRVTARSGTRRLMQYYVPLSQIPTMPARMGRVPRIFGLLVEAKGGTARVSGIIRDALRRDAPNVPSLHVTRYADVLKPAVAGITLLASFGALALAVAGVGLYATFAHAVVERRREMAIRLAIGARPSGVLRMMLRESTSLAMRGVVCGSVTAAIAGRWIQSFLFGTTLLDPIVLGSAAAIMVCVAILGAYIPARSAARTDLSLLLRSE